MDQPIENTNKCWQIGQNKDLISWVSPYIRQWGRSTHPYLNPYHRRLPPRTVSHFQRTFFPSPCHTRTHSSRHTIFHPGSPAFWSIFLELVCAGIVISLFVIIDGRQKFKLFSRNMRPFPWYRATSDQIHTTFMFFISINTLYILASLE